MNASTQLTLDEHPDRPTLTRLSIAVLIASHNRRETTVRAVNAVAAARNIADLQVVLLDDASNDGTAEAVMAADPDAIVLRGDGNAFWNGGLHEAWRRALSLNVHAFLWLNDDVLLDTDAIARLTQSYRTMQAECCNDYFILVGATRDATGSLTYSGRRYRPYPLALQLDLVPPDAKLLTAVDAFNGNIVLVPRGVVKTIGINDPQFRHGLGDYEYGLRATRNGVAVRLMPGTLGVCEANTRTKSKSFGGRDLSIREQWKLVNTPKGLPFRDWWHITRQYSGLWFPLHFVGPYRWLVLPRRFRRG
jgi:GT2 family glycosyltransferase